jgi:hypothetical protein
MRIRDANNYWRGPTKPKKVKNIVAAFFNDPSWMQKSPDPLIRAVAIAQKTEISQTAPDHILNDAVPGNPGVPKYESVGFATFPTGIWY